VLAVPGVIDVIVLEGINDVWYTPEPAAAPVITDLRKILERLHRAGIRALVGTLTPYRFRDPARNSMRAAINRWIRRSDAPDGVIDFDRALRDAGDPSTMRTRYGGPQLHPNMRGLRRMANAVPLKLLKERSCR
jgi:lysophospholipase L1-like esterase